LQIKGYKPFSSMNNLHQSWQRSWAGLQAQPAAGLFERLVACYREPHRQYHTLQHLQECLNQLQPAVELAQHPAEVELALWFHDAVYALQRQDNEQQSALWAQREILASGGSPEVADRVFALVMATRHAALPESVDERLLVDIDLSILGAPPQRFDEYERQVRDEYSWVPAWMFRRKRRAVLQEFLTRSPLFSTEHFRNQLEAQARENLRRSMAQL
jgi:predicted metal-dependent HD superfamily phosphohydrolase